MAKDRNASKEKSKEDDRKKSGRKDRRKKGHKRDRSSRSRKESKSAKPSNERSARSKRSRHSSKSKSHGSRSSHRKRSSRRSNKPATTHRCSIYCDECPDQISHKDLMKAAARDRERRQTRSVLQMVNTHGMTEAMMLRAMERQRAYESMRTLSLHLEVVCVVVVGLMAILAQQLFNTRGDLNFYVTEMTIELFLLAVVVCNITAPSTLSRFFNIIFFILAIGVNFCHILVIVRTRGTFWKCRENEVMLQHCLFHMVPTHYHTLYTSSFLLFLHLAIVLLSVSAVIFYDGCLDFYMENTPGAPQWITDEPLHLHHRLSAARKQAKQTQLTLKDLPPGTTIIREQEERSVRVTGTDRSGKQKASPDDVTITRSYTINAPGMGSATGRRSWKKPAPAPKEEPGKPKPAAAQAQVQKPEKAASKGGFCPDAFPCGGSTPIEQRKAAGRDTETELNRGRISRIPALISQIAYLSNRNLLQKQSDYMF